MSGIRLNCSACNSPLSMEPKKISKFSGIVQFIGYLIAIPSAIGVIISIVMFFSMGSATNEVMSTAQSNAEQAGAAIGATIGFGFSLFVGFCSLVGGLIGWLLIMKKKVYKCSNCGYIIDRD